MIRRLVFLSMILMAGRVAYADCLEKTNTVEIKECLQGEYGAADKELNATYAQLFSKLDAEGKEKLKKAQRAWIQYRDAEADFSGDRYRGGTFAGAASLEASRALTAQRVKELKQQLKLDVQ